MQNTIRPTVFAAAALAALTLGPVVAQSGAAAGAVEVTSGTASFDTDTNVPAISVHGKSTGLRARAEIRQSSDGLTLERVEARLPVKTISTGLGLRDEHMRKYVFTTANGQVPDLTFVADRSACAMPTSGVTTCKLSGDLSIRGTSRPFTIALKVTRNGAEYKAVGDGAVALSAYGIERPSQFGVTTTDDIKLHLEFTARTALTQVAAR